MQSGIIIADIRQEEDASPCNVYGRHKLEMEQQVLDVKPDAVVRSEAELIACLEKISTKE